jgi:large subunit ribosomal protein L1
LNMAKLGKRYGESLKAVDRAKHYPLTEAVEALVKGKKCKFDETVDVAILLGVDPKQADQMVRGTAMLPHGTGKTLRVAVITKGEKEREAKAGGADVVGGEELVEKIKGGWLEFDKVVATPDMMGLVGKLGGILGPRGLMPNPKSGTVTMDVTKALKDLKGGKIEFRVDKTGIVHAVAGKISFSSEQLCQNIASLMESVVKAKPAAAKGAYIKSVTISTTMGPGVRLDPAAFSVRV